MLNAESYTVQIISRPEDFLRLQTAWQRLFDTSIEACPMVSHGWLSAWWESFSQPSQLMHVLTAWYEGQLVAAAPLAIDREKGLLGKNRVLKGWINSWVDRYNWLVDRDHPHALTKILNHLTATQDKWDRLILRRMVEASPQTQVIKSYFSANASFVITRDLQSPYLPLPATWDELLKNLSGAFRQSLRRKLRAIEKVPDVRMWICNDASCIDAIDIISRETWQHQDGTSMTSTESIKSFYSKVIQHTAADGSLSCALMSIGGEPAAFEFNLLCRDRLYNLKLGFRQRLSELSPGIVLKSFVLQKLLDANTPSAIVEYDLMGTNEPYKRNWTNEIRSQQTLVVSSNSYLARVDFFIKHQGLDIMRKKMPSLWKNIQKIKSFASSKQK